MVERVTGDDAPTLAFAVPAAFEDWLVDHHGDQPGVWLKLARAGRGITSMTADEAVDVGLCWGWVSAKRLGLDDDFYLQKYVPRRPRSRWSQVNVRRVDLLVEAGRMRAPRLLEIEAARADGRWAAAYVSQRDFTVPDDLPAQLCQALDADPEAAGAFTALARSAQYATMLDLVTTWDDANRAAKVTRVVARLVDRPR